MKPLFATLVTLCAACLAPPAIACDAQPVANAEACTTVTAQVACDSAEKTTRTVAAADCGDCPIEQAALSIVRALKKMDASDPATADVRAALVSLAKTDSSWNARFAKVLTVSSDCSATCDGGAKPAVKLASKSSASCDGAAKTTAKLASADCSATCDGGAKPAVKLASKSSASCDGGAKTTAKLASADCSASCDGGAKTTAKLASADCSASCDGGAKPAVKLASKSSASCDGAAKTTAKLASADCSASCDGAAKTTAKLASNAGSSCSDAAATKARYVAFGCDKSDRIARAAARAYLEVLMAMKNVSGAEGCPVEAARETLANVVVQMREARADGSGAETVTVSLSAVRDADCSSKCCEAAKAGSSN